MREPASAAAPAALTEQALAVFEADEAMDVFRRRRLRFDNLPQGALHGVLDQDLHALRRVLAAELLVDLLPVPLLAPTIAVGNLTLPAGTQSLRLPAGSAADHQLVLSVGLPSLILSFVTGSSAALTTTTTTTTTRATTTTSKASKRSPSPVVGPSQRVYHTVGDSLSTYPPPDTHPPERYYPSYPHPSGSLSTPIYPSTVGEIPPSIDPSSSSRGDPSSTQSVCAPYSSLLKQKKRRPPFPRSLEIETLVDNA
mmetsp:Transcript_26335/g.85195  ORF Transcript_26335/g.85195 Transcript_26335/m.85195 type:complete len:254 (-) Transcript_26335:43-804(-)